jgi:uncharacterized protein (TIGR02117 family)
MRGGTTRRILVMTARVIVALAAIPFCYLVLALLLGLVPANVAWHQPSQGITIFVRTNGVHTWIMMPTVNRYIDWRPYAPAEDLLDPRWGRANYVAIGYGNREFYLETPTWGDLSARTAAAALFGRGSALLHVDHVQEPQPDAWQRPLKISPAQYVRLTHFIARRFRLDGSGHTVALRGRGYGPSDAFYQAIGGYSAILTCNEFTGRALRYAGIRTGLWTPFSQSIMWRLDPPEPGLPAPGARTGT